MQHGGVDGAIKDMITGGQEKGKASATHAQNMRKTYGDGLEGNFEGLSLSETLGSIDQSKIDSQAGQALGVLANKGIKPDMYVDNAMFSEMSKQQSTSAKIATQGGIAAAVATDVTDASIKALQQMGSTKGMMGVADNIEGQQEFVKKALASARNAEHRNQMLKDFENSGWTDANGIVNEGAFIKARAMLGANNMMASNSMGIGGSVVSGTIGATSDNTTVKVDGVDSSANGKTTTFDNDVTTLNNSNPLANLAKARFGGDLQKAADWTKTAEGAKWAMDPRNGASVAAAEAAHQISSRTGTDAENTALAVTGATLGTASLMAINQLTKEPLMDKEGNYVLDKHGKRVDSGVIGRGWDKGWDLVSGKSSKIEPSKSLDKTTDNSNSHKTGKNNNGSNNDSVGFNDSDKSSIHDKSPNSDKDNISNNSKSVNSEKGFSQGKTTNSGIHVPDGFDLSEPHTTNNKSWLGKSRCHQRCYRWWWLLENQTRTCCECCRTWKCK